MPVPDDAPEPIPPKPRDDEIDVHGLTHQGLVRSTNEDHFLLGALHQHLNVHATSLTLEEQQPVSGERLAFLAMVADGVGGGRRGEEASRLALQEITAYIAHSTRAFYQADAGHEDFAQILQEAALRVHARVQEAASEDDERRGMATTLTLYLGVWPWIYLLQVGDSRCYVYRNGELSQLTRDQTMAQELVDQGVLSRTDASSTRWANILSSSLGGKQSAPVVTRLQQRRGTVYLLCSDGLTKHVPDAGIRDRLATMTSAREACEALLQDALDAGGTDNITIIVGRVRPQPEG